MKHNPNSHPNHNLRRLVAIGALGLAALGVAEGVHYVHDGIQHTKYVDDPNTIPNDKASIISVKSGDTADEIAISLTPKGKDYRDLSIEIQNQADKNHFLQPGQQVRVENSLIDTNSEAYQLYGHSAEQAEAKPVAE